jgi:multidrug transporter EmrE-like cation transporter
MSRFVALFLFVSIGCECVADYLVKRWTLALGWPWFCGSLLMYNAMLLAWMAIVWKTKEISLVGTIWLLLCHVGLIAVGAGIFNEPITIRQGIGIALAMLSLILISI